MRWNMQIFNLVARLPGEQGTASDVATAVECSGGTLGGCPSEHREAHPMKRSNDRILTTFAGSLVRPSDLRDLVLERDAGNLVDDARLETRIAEAVAQAVRQQVDAGLDVVSDGEMSKPSFWTYLKERLTGFDTYASAAGR